MVYLPSHLLRRTAEPIPEPRNVFTLPMSIEEATSSLTGVRSLFGRDDTTTSDATTSSDGGVDVTTIAIACGVVIPVVAAVILLIVLHRRHINKLKQEDKNDKTASLDFGLGSVKRKNRNVNEKNVPEMTVTDFEKGVRSGKGISVDLGSNPYILPPAVQGSRESFHSLAKDNDGHDPYRPTTFVKDDSDSIHHKDNLSTYSKSSAHTDRLDVNLLSNAQRMSASTPPRVDYAPTSPRESDTSSSAPASSKSSHVDSVSTAPTSQTNSLMPGQMNGERDSYFANNAKDMRSETKHLQALINARPASDAVPTLPAVELEAPKEEPVVAKTLPRLESMQATFHDVNHTRDASDTSDYGDAFKVTPPSPGELPDKHPARSASLDQSDAPIPVASEHESALNSISEYAQNGPYDNRLSILRPLPPDDPTENPEERANRIRSFYKEYFDDSKPAHHQPTLPTYYEDYGSEYLNESTVYDPAANAFVVGNQDRPFAAPVTRRAMTPPPRAPPRFRGGPPPRGPAGRIPSGTSNYSAQPRGRSRVRSSTQSAGTKKAPLPPPAPLTSLPTPHMLKEDSMVFNPIDFAPPATYRDRQAGRRPDSPMGEKRPYSPSVRAHTPLVNAFDELPAMPSPHLLRGSGTFTALDFAPPRRFKDADLASDAGSIRSNRSNMSKAQHAALKGGAYRVSRIQKDVVGTKNDFMESLKPTWDLRGVNPSLHSSPKP